jgi:hypothetical protein
MKLLIRDELKVLMEEHKKPCVSIFMPLYRAGAEIQQNPLRFKNMLREAEQRLIANGQEEQDAKELLGPAQELLKDNDFWQHPLSGLAVYRSPDLFRYYRLPFDLQELVILADRFYIKPLLPLFYAERRFYILALSQNQVRFFQATRYSVHEIELKGIPQSLAEALKYEYPEKQPQFRTSAPGGKQHPGRRRPAIFYAYGVDIDDAKGRILRYFREIDKGLHGLLKEERAPLVLASVEYLFPIYREANTYPYLIDKGIPGNPELLSPEELHKQAWAIVQPYFQKVQEEALARYRELAGSGRVSNDVREIVPAAYCGRVESLFVAVGYQQWGTFDPDTDRVYLHQSAEPGDEDLLDLAVVQTLLHGGNVYTVNLEEMPDDPKHGPLAAVFRY